MNADQLGYKINDSKDELEGTDTESLKDEREEYPSDEELKNGYTFYSRRSDTKGCHQKKYCWKRKIMFRNDRNTF